MPICPACQSESAKLIGDKNNCTIHQCLSCKTFYASAYDRSAAAAIYQDYEPTNCYAGKPAKKMRRARARLARLKKKFGGTRYLDVGCNIGYTVEAAREVGYEAHGFDIDPVAIEQAKKLFPAGHFHCGDLSSVPGPFDIIYCAEVIEHVPDPLAFARQLVSLLKPGGALFLTTPDSGHPLRDRNFLNWHEVFPPEHIIWFNRRSIKSTLQRAGFDQVWFRLNLKTGLRVYARKAA